MAEFHRSVASRKRRLEQTEGTLLAKRAKKTGQNDTSETNKRLEERRKL